MRSPTTTGLVLTLVLCAPTAAADDCRQCPDGGAVLRVNVRSKATAPDGRSWPTAFQKVQDAIDAASAGDCIWVAKGRYLPGPGRLATFSIAKSLNLYGGFVGHEACLAARPAPIGGTRLSGQIGNPSLKTDNTYTVVTIMGMLGTVDVLLDGFTIRDGYNDGPVGLGGGITAVAAHSLELRNCAVRDNWAVLGAGLYTDGGGLDIALSQFTGNDAWRDGGGLWAATVSSSFSVNPSNGQFDTGANIHNTLFRNNSADKRGGGFYLAGIAENLDVSFTNCLFHGNGMRAPAGTVVTREGGAGFIDEATPTGFYRPGRALLTNCTVSNNHVVGSGSGSAFFVEEQLGVFPGELSYYNSIIHGNLPGSVSTITGVLGVGGANSLLEKVPPGSGLLCAPSAPCTVEAGCTVFDCAPVFQAGTFVPHPTLSPAIDQGRDVLAMPDVFDLDGDGDTSEPTPIDYAGSARIQGSGACGAPASNCIDMGAYEASR